MAGNLAPQLPFQLPVPGFLCRSNASGGGFRCPCIYCKVEASLGMTLIGGGLVCLGIYGNFKVSWAGVTLIVGTLAPRYQLPGRGPFAMCISAASPQCRWDSCASVSFVRSRCLVPEGRLA